MDTLDLGAKLAGVDTFCGQGQQGDLVTAIGECARQACHHFLGAATSQILQDDQQLLFHLFHTR
ncbi:hypothetical protein D3C77_698530 [compost metagenome]